MDYLRVFKTPSWFTAWSSTSPDLKRLLHCFEVQRLQGQSGEQSTLSVFRAQTDAERLQNVAALFQNDPGTADKTFGIRLSSADCAEAGIRIEASDAATGVRFVDKRHADLVGTASEFESLAGIVIRKIWEGEQRLKVFSAHSILGEVAVLSHYIDHLDDGAKERCSRVLKKNEEKVRIQASVHVELCGKLTDKSGDVAITAKRVLSPKPPSPSIVRQIWDFFRL